MRFRDDIDIDNTWVTSDSHFGHDNIIGFCHRPEEHEQVLIAEWRAHVPDDATVLHLGDLAYRGNARFKHVMAKELTGARKLLVLGNHDKQSFKFYKDCGFKLARPFALPFGKFATVSFSHYPWGPPDDEGAMPAHHWRVHGHIHNGGYQRSAFVPFLARHINVSVEQTRYRPVNLGILLRGAINGELPATPEAEAKLTEAARQRAITRRTERKPS